MVIRTSPDLKFEKFFFSAGEQNFLVLLIFEEKVFLIKVKTWLCGCFKFLLGQEHFLDSLLLGFIPVFSLVRHEIIRKKTLCV